MYVCLTRNLVNTFQLRFDIFVVCSSVHAIFVSDGLFEIRCLGSNNCRSDRIFGHR